MAKSFSWEALCRRCGRCCYEKYEIDGRIYYSDVPCEFLDPDSSLCTVYDQRHLRKIDCAALTPRVVAMGALPADCPYVAGLSGYVPPVPFGATQESNE